MTSFGTTPTMPCVVDAKRAEPFSRWNALLAARREKGNRHVHLVSRFRNIHHTMSSKAYVARLMPASAAKSPHCSHADRKQLSVRSGRAKPHPIKLPFSQKYCASRLFLYFFCSFDFQAQIHNNPFHPKNGPPPVVMRTGVVFV